MRTFDVFDTVLTRAVGDPGAVARVVGERLRADGITGCSPGAWARARQRVDEDVIAHGREAPTLAAIHAELARRLDLADGAAGATLDAELAVERELSRVVPGAPDRLEAARAAVEGGRIVFVSDTPLPEAFLVELLERGGLWRPGDRLHASADSGGSKSAGDLFGAVAAELGVAPDAIAHTGDDPHSDVRMARAAGWRATHAPEARLNRYEHLLERDAAATDGLTSRLAGASRLGRLEAVAAGVDPALAAVAAGVGAPLFVGYALWLARQARRLELDRLCFVARDGEVMLEVARPVLAALGVDTDLRYLYGSRQAWQIPAAGASGTYVPGRLMYIDGQQRSARELLTRVRLDPAEAHALTGDARFAPGAADVPLDGDGQAAVVALLERPPLAGRLQDGSDEQRGLLLEYLAQEGVTGAGRVGMVDIGWLGWMGRALETCVDAAGEEPPAAWLYLGLLEGARAAAGPALAARQRGFLFDLDRGEGLPHRLYNVHNLLEALCQATHGRTVGYRRRDGDGTVEPVLDPSSREQALVAWGLPDYRLTLRHTVAHLLEGAPALDAPVDLRPAIGSVLEEFWERPTAAEAEAWGALPFDVDVAGGAAVPLAPPARLGVAARELRDHRRLKVRPEGSWRAGVALRSAPPWRAVFRGTAAVQHQLPRVRRIPGRLRALRSG
jgi:FMN phosphatase YigB (HAD superfamily)